MEQKRIVKLTHTKTSAEVTFSPLNMKPVPRRMCGGYHKNVRTGEVIKDKEAAVKRGQSKESLAASNAYLKELIRANTLDLDKTVLLTLTYAEKQTDPQKALLDYKRFWERLCGKVTEFGKINYICARELHSDLISYHIHAILFFHYSTKAVYIPAAKMEKLWGHGSINMGRKKGMNDCFFYLAPHEVNEITPQNEHMHEKALRQMEMPSGMKLFSTSRDIIRPKTIYDTQENIERFLEENGYNFTRQTSYKSRMIMLDGERCNITKKEYKKEPEESPKKR